MAADDFVASARCTADVLGTPGLSLGERVLGSIEATRAATGCNTNLGIVLLCAPLAQAALEEERDRTLRTGLCRVIGEASVEDTALVFAAIRLAGPAGLGGSERHDVRRPATAPLLAVMREAANRDRVARQYACGFEDIFDLGLAVLARSRGRWPGPHAVAALYLTFLARFKDSHIQRKLGTVAAQRVRLEAQRLVAGIEASESSEVGCRGPDEVRPQSEEPAHQPRYERRLDGGNTACRPPPRREGESCRGPTSAGRDWTDNYVRR